MPELPEVETLRRSLDRGARGQRITQVVIANPKSLKGQDADVFCHRVTGSTIQRADRRGKYLLIPLTAPPLPDSPSISLCIHLKMRGQLLLENAAAPAGKYHCVSLMLGDNRALRFYDMWTWGEVRALTDEEMGRIAGLQQMGAEPLESGWDGDALARALANRSGAIKPALLDQSVVAGVGNIYADESLFRARIEPRRAAQSLSKAEVERLARAIRTVLYEAVEGGGTTSDNYVDAEGAVGRYQPRVYDRGGAPCPACGNVLERIRLAGRGTVFCPRCQT